MKTLLAIIISSALVLFLVGCQDNSELMAYRAQVKIEEQNKALMRSGIEMLNKSDIDGFLNLCSDDLRYYYPSNSEGVAFEGYAERLRSVYLAFPDIKFTIEELIAKDHKVVARFSVKATSKGEYGGVPATGNKIEGSFMVIDTLKDGKVVEIREENDQLSLMQQLGMELKPKAETQSAIKPPSLPAMK